MNRFVSVWLPDWPIERMTRARPADMPADRPLALLHAGTLGLVISAVNASARAAGLASGLALADARAMFPDLTTRPAEPARDAEALAGLAHWCVRYGPARNIEGVCDPDGASPATRGPGTFVEAGAHGLWIDITGVAHLFGGEAALLSDLTGQLARLGITARSGLADTAAAAFALARYRASRTHPFAIASAGGTRAALADLPVAGLRLAPEAIALLHRLGLKRIGQLYDLPRAAMARRFRSAGQARGRRPRGSARLFEERAAAVLVRLDQALGLAAEPRAGLPEPVEHAARELFGEPLVTAEAITAAIADLAARLCADLTSTGLAARRFHLTLCRTDGSHARAGIGTSRPCRDPGHIERLLGERLGTIDAGFGVEAAVLQAAVVGPVDPAQMALGSAAGQDPHRKVAELIDRLSSRLGEATVLRLGLRASHIPECVCVRLPALGASATLNAGSATMATTLSEPLRPLFLLAPPEPITAIAEIPDGPPHHFIWRRVGRRIVAAEGPERIAPEWWRAQGAHIGLRPTAAGAARIAPERVDTCVKRPRTRDYYRIEDTQGARYWVFRDGLFDDGNMAQSRPAWFVHGLFA